jgi:hypothetical protein
VFVPAPFFRAGHHGRIGTYSVLPTCGKLYVLLSAGWFAGTLLLLPRFSATAAFPQEKQVSRPAASFSSRRDLADPDMQLL